MTLASMAAQQQFKAPYRQAVAPYVAQ